jgi:alanine racemase
MRTWIEISEKNIRNNVNVFRKLIKPECFLMSVVKSNAYGHNLIDFSLLADKAGVDWLGVDSIIEAETLRKVGLEKPILVLGHTITQKIAVAEKENISLTIADFPSLKSIKKNKVKIHLKIDSGMHRQGFFVSEIPRVIKTIKNSPLITLEGVYTHFASAKNPAFPKETLTQIEEFKQALNLLEKAGFKKLIKHASATSGAIIFPQAHFDMVRIGIGLYGLWPSQETQSAYQEKIHIKPVLSWKTIVAQIKTLPKQSRIGYDLTETLTRKTKVALLPIGYWHGFPRALSSIGQVVIRNQKARVLGRVSMDMISVDVTDIKNIQTNDQVVLIGKKITADDLAFLSDTTCYEIITRLNPRIKRFIVK